MENGISIKEINSVELTDLKINEKIMQNFNSFTTIRK